MERPAEKDGMIYTKGVHTLKITPYVEEETGKEKWNVKRTKEQSLDEYLDRGDTSEGHDIKIQD